MSGWTTRLPCPDSSNGTTWYKFGQYCKSRPMCANWGHYPKFCFIITLPVSGSYVYESQFYSMALTAVTHTPNRPLSPTPFSLSHTLLVFTTTRRREGWGGLLYVLVLRWIGTGKDEDSVTRFGEISPFWPKFKLIWQNFEGLFSIWHNFESTLANFVCFWAYVYCCEQPYSEK